MWYAPPAPVSPGGGVYLALTPSATKKPLPDPVVNGDGSASPYTLLFALVVHVAGRGVIEIGAASCMIILYVNAAAGVVLNDAVMWYSRSATVSSSARE